jgi:hypothetical protein
LTTFTIVWQARKAPRKVGPNINPELIIHKFPENHCKIDVRKSHFEILKFSLIVVLKKNIENLKFLKENIHNRTVIENEKM